jgi:hypothetical protein
MTTVARKMFSALGSTRGRSQSRDPSYTVPSVPENTTMLPEIEEEEEEPCQAWIAKLPRPDGNLQANEQTSSWDSPSVPELPETGLFEMEAAHVAEMSADWSFSHELPDSQVSGIDISKVIQEPQSNMYSPHGTRSHSPKDWDFLKEGLAGIQEGPRPPRSFLPRLNTSVPNNTSQTQEEIQRLTQWPNTLMSATIVSPLSPTGRMFEFGSLDTLDISPTESELSLKSLFTDSGYSSATVDSSFDGSASSGSFRLHDSMRKKNKGRTVADDPQKLIPENDQHFFLENQAIKNQLLYPEMSTFSSDSELMVYGATITDEHNSTQPTVPVTPKVLSPHWSNAKTLVASFSDVLDEHLKHSRTRLQQMASNIIVKELLSLSSSTIVSLGLETLAALLQGRRSSAVVSIFAFTHVAYALAVAVDHDSSKVQTAEWFSDSLKLLENLPDKQRTCYTQIVRVIWQPRSESATADSTDSSHLNAENRLVTACKHFLDRMFTTSFFNL